MTVAWTRDHLARLDQAACELPGLDPASAEPIIDDQYLWDLWPVCHPDGSVADFDGAEAWMALSAPRTLQPIERHDRTRLRLLSKADGLWRDLGLVFPEGATPGSREWAGSAVIDGRRLRVRYTATGARHEQTPSFVQRMFEAAADFDGLTFANWSDHREMLPQGRGHYRSTLDQTTGRPGFIKAYRDPAVFVDPASGAQTLLFAASLADAKSDYDGAVGRATRRDAGAPWEVGPPVLHADGVNNEMERPHIVHHDGRYYLFFSTQARTFHPEVWGPTGLYGFVADHLDGEWTPLNDSGLVLRNPEADPYQCYSWLVLDDLRATAFVDMPNLGGRDPDEIEAAGEMARYFVGTPAPPVRLVLDGPSARLAD